jgi:hypothetical protein
MSTRQPALFALALGALLIPQSVSAATLTVPVRANVQGFPAIQTIGSIVADDKFRGLSGPESVASGLTATFTFNNAFHFLDDFYEFDWVQIVNAEGGDRDFFPRPLPTIDPRPAHNPDSYPFYYSMAEWAANMFAGQVLHQERMFSTFGDVPNQPAGTTFSFSAFLVVRDANSYSLGGSNQFCVLGGFEWMYAGADGDFDNNRGTSTVGDPIIGPLDPRLIDRINLAIDSAAAAADNDTYRSWRNAALGNCTLIPEPGTTMMLLLGAGLLLPLHRWLARRKSSC